jgi:hypothetical protein
MAAHELRRRQAAEERSCFAGPRGYSNLHAETFGHSRIVSRAAAGVMSVWHDVQGFGIL